jgi:hypothetical protein
VVVVCIVPPVPTTMMMDGSIVHPSWDSNGCKVAYFVSLMAVASVQFNYSRFNC